MKKALIFFILLCFCILLYFSISHTNLESILRKIGVYPLQEKFTVLSFEAPTTLPSNVQSSSSLSFGFVVDNKEGVDMFYNYNVNLKPSSLESRQYDSGILFVPKGQSKTKNVVINSDELTTVTVVSVVLKDLDQHIDFEVQIASSTDNSKI